MNFTRRLIFNLVFFVLLLLFLIVLRRGHRSQTAGRSAPRWCSRRKAVWWSSTAADPFTRTLAKVMGDNDAKEVQLRDLLRAIEAAKDDKRIERVLLRVDELQPSGYARCAKWPRRCRGCARRASRSWLSASSTARRSTCWPRRPTRSIWIRWAACCSKAWPATASTTARACRTSSAWTCICSGWASTSRRPNLSSSMPHRRSPRKPICSG